MRADDGTCEVRAPTVFSTAMAHVIGIQPPAGTDVAQDTGETHARTAEFDVQAATPTAT
jgi:hypothetical protein